MRDRWPDGPGPLDAVSTLLTLAIGLGAITLAVYWAVTTTWAMPAAIPITGTVTAAWLLLRCRTRRLALLDELTGPDETASFAELRPLHYSEHGACAARHVGHDDRDIVITRLGDRYASGHLTAAEFEARATEASQARTCADLARTLRDLP